MFSIPDQMAIRKAQMLLPIKQGIGRATRMVELYFNAMEMWERHVKG